MAAALKSMLREFCIAYYAYAPRAWTKAQWDAKRIRCLKSIYKILKIIINILTKFLNIKNI